MFSFAKKEKKYPVNISKDNSKWEKQIMLSMILNKEGLHCLVAKKLSSLLKGTTQWCLLFSEFSSPVENIVYLKKFPVFHNQSNYCCHFTIKELAEAASRSILSRRKFRKMQNLFSTNKKKSK